MRAAVLVGPGRLEIQDIEKPKIGAGEVLVKLKYCGICTLEQRLYTGQVSARYPVIPGHETAGLVEEVGSEVLADINPGDPVTLDLVIRCGECYYCRTGASNLCLNRFKDGQRVLGGFAEYRAVDAKQIFAVPRDLPLKEAAFAEPVACCIRSLKSVGLGLAEDLLIVGAGPMGLMHLLVALCLGARIFISDPDRRRLRTARQLGAFLAIDPSRENLLEKIREHTGGRGVDACVVTSPAPAALESAFAATAANGRINIYTSYNEKLALSIDADTVHRSGVLVTGSEGRTEEDFLRAVRLLAFGKVRVSALISKLTCFGSIEEGMRAAMSPATFRVLLDHEADAG